MQKQGKIGLLTSTTGGAQGPQRAEGDPPLPQDPGEPGTRQTEGDGDRAQEQDQVRSRERLLPTEAEGELRPGSVGAQQVESEAGLPPDPKGPRGVHQGHELRANHEQVATLPTMAVDSGTKSGSKESSSVGKSR